MIEVEHLTKYYGDIPGIMDLNFKIEPGEIVGLLGPNGSGKTTTMRIITSFMPASSGTVRVDGHDVHKDSMQVRQRIGYLPEHPPLYEEMSVESYLKFVAEIRHIPRKMVKQRIESVIERCGLTEMRKRLIHKLSKGYRQRTGLAQALIHDPPVLILDEPTVGLDPRQIAEVRNLIKGLAGDHTVVLCTHILHEVTLVCKRALIIHRGRITVDDTLENLTQEGDLEKAFLDVVEKSEQAYEDQESKPDAEVQS